MKKLTAGIFATILGLTAVDAFAAAAGTPVASTNYVQGAIQSLTVEKVGTSDATSYIKSVSETNGKISAESGTLATVATTGAYDDLTGTPDLTVYAKSAELDATYVTETELTNSQNDQNATIASTYATQTALNAVKATADAAAPQATTYTKTEVDGLIAASEYDDTALAGRVTTAEGKISTIEGQQTTQDAKIKALEDAGYITDAALDGLATEDYVDAAVLVEYEVNQTQAQQINALTTDMANYVKWTDVVDSYTE